MFKRKVEIRFVKDTAPKDADKNPNEAYERINSAKAIKELVTYVAIASVTVIVASVVAHTIGDIIVEAVTSTKE